MSPFLVSLMFGVGVGGFVWSKLAASTGNARPSSVFTGAAIVGVVAFIVLFTLMKFIFNM